MAPITPGPIGEREALERYNSQYRAAFFSGLMSEADMQAEWRGRVWMPAAGELDGTNIVTSELFALAQQRFGNGLPLQFTNIAFYQMFLDAERYGLGFKVDRDKIREDRAGLYAQAAFQLGSGAEEFWWLYFWDIMCGPAFDGSQGFTALDGTTLISDSHPYTDINGNTAFYSNKLTAVFSRDAWVEAIRLHHLFRTLQGRRMSKPRSIELVVGPKNEDLARSLFDGMLVNGGDSNTIVKPTSWMVSRALVDSYEEYWFVRFTYSDMSIKELTFREDQAPALISDMDINSDAIWHNNEYRWRVEQKRGFGTGHPCAIIGSDGTVP